ncbi:MAG: PBP1A family penicillin-binding protein [Syntrophomonadaceae bacterium]|nr:PBP1A family penicillin-binding protein [Syntrophomonadaceae bacterium]
MKALFKIGVFLGALILFIFCFYIGVSLTQTTPKIAEFFTGINSWEYQIQDQTVVYYADGTEMGKLGYQRKYSEDFPDFLKQAVVAVEDRRFYQHSGFDAKSIGRAIYNDLKAGSKAEGGSTITQQLARTLFLTQEKSYTRKIKELFIAISIENKYTKEAILNMYLNEIYMGRGCSGMACAASSYFGKNVSQLNKAEMTMLVGIIQSPEYYSPEKNMEGLKARQQTVVDVLVDQGILTEAQGKDIMKQNLNIKPFQTTSYKHPYYMAYLSSQLEDMVGAQRLYGGGLKIYTTIDKNMQVAAENSIASNARSFASRGITAKDMALVSVDPATGGIRAMVGGADWKRNQINMAITPRQPGSAIKPLYYAAAINERLIKADTVINNKKRDFNGYSPDNYASSPEKVTVKDALVHSYNVASVEVMSKLGVEKAVRYLTDYGITVDKQDHNLALALGGMTHGISPVQMASAYTIFPNQGRQEGAFSVIKIVDTKDKVLYQDKSGSKRVISSTTAAAMDNILKAVVTQGTGTNARISIPSGGKTGTTEGKAGVKSTNDLWYVGYTSELVTAVWVGNSDSSEVKGFGTYGGAVAAPIWRDYMNQAIYRGALKEAPASNNDETPVPETTTPDVPTDSDSGDNPTGTDPNSGTDSDSNQNNSPDIPDSGGNTDDDTEPAEPDTGTSPDTDKETGTDNPNRPPATNQQD